MNQRENIFQRNPKKSLAAIIGGLAALLFVLTEWILRITMGLGNPIIYDSNPFYGYRPIAHQEVSRFNGARIAINNLGLRADSDWNKEKNNKILFLGDSVTYGGSYISNAELFSTLATKNLPGMQVGNAAVNAWGVQNIYGLIVQSAFLPAKHYVTVLIDGDFYRGLTRLQGMPFWCVKPTLALQEVLFYFYYQETNKRYRDWRTYASPEEQAAVVNEATQKLKEMDDFLKAKGFTHSIMISPSQGEVLHAKGPDKLVRDALRSYDLQPVELVQKIRFSDADKSQIFHDDVHLEKIGHRIWGEAIGAELHQKLAHIDTSKL